MEYQTFLLSEVGQIVSGATPKTSDAENFGGDIAWLTPADLSGYTEKYISHGARNITQKGYDGCSTQLMPAGTVLFSSRAPIGYVAIARNPICTNQGFKSIIPNSNIDSEFLYYQLKYLKKQIQDMGSGTTFREISAKTLGKVNIVVPSLAEQKRIVARIEELFSELDNGVETLQKTKQQLAVYRQAVLKDAFSGCDKQASVSSVCTHVTDGDHMPPPKAASGIPFIMISNIDGNRIDFSDTAFVGRDYYENIDSKRRPQVGDVLYSVTGSFGIPVLVDFEKEFCFQRHIALLRPNDSILSRYLYYAMQAPEVYAQASEGATGTAQKTVGLTVLRRILIPYTKSKLEQEEIVRDIENKMSVCDSIEKTVDTALQQAEAMRQTILKQAFEGRF